MKILFILMMALSLWANIGNIMALKGSAEVERVGEKLKATNGMELLEGDILVTQKRSRVQVMLKDSTVITIGANSSFSFLEYSFDGTKNSKVTMRANRGFFRSVTGKIGQVAPARFKVKTASATIGIRGTDFSGNVAEGREVFRCYQGAIFIEFSGGLRDLDAGMMAEILKDKFVIKEMKTEEPKEGKKGDGKGKSKPTVKKGIVVESRDGSEVPTEVISDVTQVVEDAERGTNTLGDPSTSSQNRATEY